MEEECTESSANTNTNSTTGCATAANEAAGPADNNTASVTNLASYAQDFQRCAGWLLLLLLLLTGSGGVMNSPEVAVQSWSLFSSCCKAPCQQSVSQ
jgi:hypothetical protein